MHRVRIGRVVTIGAAVCTGVALTALLGVVAAVAVEDHGATCFPTPTGAAQVGRLSVTWTDPSQPDRFAPAADVPRTVIAWIWYPARPSQWSSRAQYVPRDWRAALAHTRGAWMMALFTRDLARVRVHSWRAPPVAPAARPYPVVLLRAGLAAMTLNYTMLAEELASHGYVVVGIDAPYRTFLTVLPDGRVIERTRANDLDVASERDRTRLADALVERWSSDLAMTLDRLAELNLADPSGRFTGRLDLSHVGAMGHSLGGAEAAQFCRDDARCVAGIDIDGAPFGSVVREGVNRPFLFMTGEHDADDPETKRISADISRIVAREPPGKRWWIVIPGANHFSFSDTPLIKSHLVQRILLWAGVLHMDGNTQLAITSEYVRRFFDFYLKRLPVSGS